MVEFPIGVVIAAAGALVLLTLGWLAESYFCRAMSRNFWSMSALCRKVMEDRDELLRENIELRRQRAEMN